MTHPLSRRDFAELLALWTAAPYIALDAPLLIPSGSETGSLHGAQQQAEPSPLANALAEAIRIRYGDRLSAGDLKTIAQGIETRLQGLERLYRVALANTDEPDFVFSVYRGRDGEGRGRTGQDGEAGNG
jgi:hypothetical protein